MRKISLLLLVLCLFFGGCNSNTSSDSTSKNQTSTTLEQSTGGMPSTNTTSQSTTNQGSTNKEMAMDIFVNSIDYGNVQKINDYGFYRFEKDALAKKLPMPSTNVNSVEELVDVLDYCAFYHIEEMKKGIMKSVHWMICLRLWSVIY